MIDFLRLLTAWLAGCGLGVVFFVGLWWTVLKGTVARQAAIWFLVSFLLRTGVVLAGFFFVARQGFTPMLTCLLGFVMARSLVLRLTRTAAAVRTNSVQEAQHAPES